MTALSAERNTPTKEGKTFAGPAAAAKKFYLGAIAMLDASGNVTPGATATTLLPAGRVKTTVDNSGGAAGALNVEYEKGVFRYANSASGDLIGRTEIGKNCYVVDDQTVAKTDGTGTRSIAGKVKDVDAQGVWVEFL